jgi:tripartite-type tricarboxylate transporter receptor subunit TctC
MLDAAFLKIISAHMDAIRSDPLPVDVETARWSPAGPLGNCSRRWLTTWNSKNSSKRQRSCFLRYRNRRRMRYTKENAMKHLAGLALSLGIALAPSMLRAQDAWPARPITFVVPYGAGGYFGLGRPADRALRREALGKPVIVDNRAGAGGIVGTQAVANAPIDGYTFCVCSIGAISVAPFDPNQKVGYDPLQDLAPVGIVSSIAQVVIVRKDLPVKTLAELVSYAKVNPGKLNYGSSGAGGLTHYSVELFQARTGIKVVHIPFKSGGRSTAAVVSGEVDFSFANMTDGLPQVSWIGARPSRDFAQTQPLLARYSHRA